MFSTFSANSGSLERLKGCRMRGAAAVDAPAYKRCTARRLTTLTGFGHGAAGPMRGVAGRFGAGQVQYLGDDLGRKRSAARLARSVVQQAFDALLSVSRLPAPDRRSADARAPRHLLHGQAVSRIKDNARPLHMFERTIAIRDDGQQTLTILGGRKGRPRRFELHAHTDTRTSTHGIP